MIDTNEFLNTLNEYGFDFFTGVPDSLLKNLCAGISNSVKLSNITAANEGNAVSLACGYYLSSGKPAVVYMQNSGIGNAVNPLLSLADEDVYSIPFLMIVGWRGEPGTSDEPQHKKQGKLTIPLFETIGIQTLIPENDYRKCIEECAEYMKKYSRPIALVIRKNTFSDIPFLKPENNFSLSREESLEIITEHLSENDIIVSTTGKTSRELFEIRERRHQSHRCDFLTVGSMGHTSSIALGISLGTDKTVYCADGDGSFLMHMGSAAVNSVNMGENFRYIVFNNGAHESVGGQQTVGFDVNIPEILAACGFSEVFSVKTADELHEGIEKMKKTPKSAMVIFIKQGSRSNLGRPLLSPLENKKLLMENLIK